MYEATVCILQAVAFFIAKATPIIHITPLVAEKIGLKRAKNMI